MSSSSYSPKTNSSNGNSSNLIIGIVVGIIIFIICFCLWGNCTDSGKQAFANIRNKINLPGLGGPNLKDLDVFMFYSPTCPWCIKTIDLLKSTKQSGNITMIDMSKPEGAEIAKQFGADKQPVPSFISRKNKTGTTGYRNSIQELIKALQPPSGSGSGSLSNASSSEEPSSGGSPREINIDIIKNLQIILFTKEGCGWCQKAKEHLSQTGTIDVIKVVDIMTPEGQSLVPQMFPQGPPGGFPAWVSIATGKNIIGYRTIDQVAQGLQYPA